MPISSTAAKDPRVRMRPTPDELERVCQAADDCHEKGDSFTSLRLNASSSHIRHFGGDAYVSFAAKIVALERSLHTLYTPAVLDKEATLVLEGWPDETRKAFTILREMLIEMVDQFGLEPVVAQPIQDTPSVPLQLEDAPYLSRYDLQRLSTARAAIQRGLAAWRYQNPAEAARQAIEAATPQDLISQESAAELLGCSDRTIRRRIEEGALTAYGPDRQLSEAEVVEKKLQLFKRKPRSVGKRRKTRT